MARAVIVIQASSPQALAGEDIDLRAAGAFRETDARDIDHAFSTRVKRSFISSVGSPAMMVRVISVVPS